MADQEEFPLLQGQPPAQAAPPPQQDVAGLAQRWNSWMSSPQNRASLIQFGIALSQPIPAGQNIGGHIGSAFGQAGEASDRVTEREMKQQELESKQDLRGAQAEAQIARAGAAETRAGAARERANLATERLRLYDENAALRADTQLITAYHKEMGRIRQQNALGGGPDGKPIPEPTFEEWVGANPNLRTRYGGGAAPTEGGGDVIERARRALRGGAPRDSVIQRLRDLGVTPPPDL